MRFAIVAFAVAIAIVPSPASAQLLVGPAKIKAPEGADTSELERTIEDAVWHGVVRQRGIVFNLSTLTRQTMKTCERKVGCIANAAKDARVKLVLMPFVSQERGDLVVRIYVITSEPARIITVTVARWPTERATIDLKTTIENSLKEIAPILRGEKLPEPEVAEAPKEAGTTPVAPPSPPPVVATSTRAEPKRNPAAELATWIKSGRDRAAVNGGFTILVYGDARPIQIAELIQKLGDEIEGLTGLAPILEQQDESCISPDHCAKDVLDRTHTMELVLLGAKRRGKGAAVQLQRRGRREGNVNRAAITIPRPARSREPTIPELARSLFPEGRDITPEIPEIPE